MLRVIAGSARRIQLDAGPNPATRPLLEMARGALFNALGDRVAEASVLDCYAGSGSLGIEALSRGADKACFVEADARTVRALKDNLLRCRLEARATVVTGRAERVAATLSPAFDLVFVDPPFADARDWAGNPDGQAVMRAAARLLAPGGLVVFRYEVARDAPPDWPGLDLLRDREYGRSRLCWYGGAAAVDGE